MVEFYNADILTGIKKIGLIAGNGRLPAVWAGNAKKHGMQVIALAFKGETEKELSAYADKIYWLDIGELKKLIAILKQENIRQAVMIGQIRPAHFLFKGFFSKDELLKKILNEVKDKRGNSLLAAFAGYLEKEKINLLDSRTFIWDYLPEKGNLTGVDVDEKANKDIEFGFKIAKQVAELDIGQTVIVKDLTVLAVEAIEGTDSAILRAAKLGGRGLVAVKVTSPKHDMRFDIPVIGPKTVFYLSKTKAKALAIEAQRTLIVDKERTLKMAERKQIAIIAI